MRLIIIGGGIIGLATGWRMRQAGWEVTLFDKRRAGEGASWAAAGMLAVCAELEPGQEAGFALGRDSQLRWPGFVRDLEIATGQTVGYRETGTLEVAVSDKDVARLRDSYTFFKQLDAPMQWFTKDAACDLEPALSHHIQAALFAVEDYHVDARAVVTALREAFLRSGGKLIEDCAVKALRVEDHQISDVETAQGVYEADHVLLAAGWEARDLMLPLGIDLPITPVKGQMAALDGSVLRDTVLTHVVRTDHTYIVPREDGRIVLGASSEPGASDRTITEEAIAELVQGAIEIVPVLRDCPVIDRWAGVRPASPDGMPILGPSGWAHLTLATGHHRNGILWAPASIDLLCDYIQSGVESPLFQAFSLARFDRL